MTEKFIRLSSQKEQDDYFDPYSREISVIGFRQSWVNEIESQMRQVYEEKDREEKGGSKKSERE